LVLAPTRELAVQIKEECDKFGKSSDIKNTVVYGGVPKSKQIRDLQSGIEIVIGESFIFLLRSNPSTIFRWLLLTKNNVISYQQRLEG
jgi:superfamily II DNA/RNA helicase